MTTSEYLKTNLPKEWTSCGVTKFLKNTKSYKDDVIHMMRVAFAHVYNFNRVEASKWFQRKTFSSHFFSIALNKEQLQKYRRKEKWR